MKMKLRLVCALVITSVLLAGGLVSARQGESDSASQAARSSPEWLKSGIIYQVFVRSFSSEGNLQGVTKELDRLHNLGVNILWLMPIHPVGQVKKKGSLGSPYSVRDYYAIDPSLGTKDDLKQLVRATHDKGMKVIIDMVANHTAWDSVMMAHPEFYKKDKQGNITYPYDWDDVAALDYSNPKLRRYMIDMLVYWIKEFDLDGYRCDAAAEIPTDFWEQARTELDRVKADIIMLAEASKPELLRSAFNIDYSWPLLHSFEAVMMGGEPASALHQTIDEQRAKFPKGALHMRVIDDHDELRAVTQFGFPGMVAAASVMMTLDGVPLIYNGMEVGDSTQSRAPALFETQKIFWQAEDWHPEYPKFFTAMDALRHLHPALQKGELQWVHNSDEQHVVSYLRPFTGDEVLVVANLSNTPFRGTVEVAGGEWRQVPIPLSPKASIALPFVSLDAFQFRIFERIF
ncbi:MAG TPA: alpha-amylase family glycosyl hydrolase [Bryobacteraceae bacterium]|jgi:glycosidase|nr:alpha-amylase family glycosyl hydrolase [Bryobacteraceae bacterium]